MFLQNIVNTTRILSYFSFFSDISISNFRLHVILEAL